jgi:hypothetical protein
VKTTTIRVELPPTLCALANLPREIPLSVPTPPTQKSLLDALESAHPTLRGTIRDHTTLKRRPFLRFFAAGRDLSHCAADAPLPEGVELFMIVGAIAGG